jgi:hypothetical protein
MIAFSFTSADVAVMLEPTEWLVDQVLSFLDERPEEFVSRRHRALQGEGLSNSEIFARLAAELERWRFRAPAYSERQIRRMIYG